MRGVRCGRAGMLRHQLRIGDRLLHVDVEVRGVRRDGAAVLRRERVHERDERVCERDLRGLWCGEPTLLWRERLRDRERVRELGVRALRRNGTALLRGRVHGQHGRVHERDVRHVRRQRAGLLSGVELRTGISLLDVDVEVRGVRGGQAAVLRDELQHGRDLRDRRDMRRVWEPQSTVLRERLLGRNGLRVEHVRHLRRGGTGVLRGERLLAERVHLLRGELRGVRGGKPTVLRVELRHQQLDLYVGGDVCRLWRYGPGLLRGRNLHGVAGVYERDVRELRRKRSALLHEHDVRDRVHLLVGVDLHGVRGGQPTLLHGTDVRDGNALWDVWNVQRVRGGHPTLLRDQLQRDGDLLGDHVRGLRWGKPAVLHGEHMHGDLNGV